MIELCGLEGQSATNFMKIVGKKIMGIKLEDNMLHMSFGSHGSLVLSDEGQCCCEARYITTDDKLEEYVGGVLLNIELKEAPIPMLPDDSDECHEIIFVEVVTSKGPFVLVTHNEHNGYYGGFDIAVEFTADKESHDDR